MAADDVTSIYNLALNAVGARSNVASRTENSREAQVCELWYTVVRDTVFAAAPWPELTRLAYLTLLDTRDEEAAWANTNARPGFAYSYQMPADAIRPQYLTNFDRFLLTSYPEGKFALDTNTQDAILAYTTRDLAPSLWPAQLKMAMVYGLASHICLPLTGKPGRAKQLVDQANLILTAARETSANSSNETFDYVPDWIAARGFSGNTVSDRFIYPVGSLLTVSAGVN